MDEQDNLERNLRDRGYTLSEDPRTRDLDQRQRDIMDGAWMSTRVTDEDRRQMGYVSQAHPRRIDWYRVAALTIVILAACAATVALGAALVLVLTAL